MTLGYDDYPTILVDDLTQRVGLSHLSQTIPVDERHPGPLLKVLASSCWKKKAVDRKSWTLSAAPSGSLRPTFPCNERGFGHLVAIPINIST